MTDGTRRDITGYFSDRMSAVNNVTASGVFSKSSGGVDDWAGGSSHRRDFTRIDFKASRVTHTAAEACPYNMHLLYLIAY